MNIDAQLLTLSPADRSSFMNRMGLLANSSAFMEESRLPSDAWDSLIKSVLAIPEPARRDQITKAIQNALQPYILAGPAASPVPLFIERVGNARAAVFSQKYAGLSDDEIEKDWEDFLRAVRNNDLRGILSQFGSLLVGKRPVWGSPFQSLAARPFAGIGITVLCERLALGRAPAPDGNDWVFCYSSPSSHTPKVPTVADACGDKSWHEPFFPAPETETIGRTKPPHPSVEPFLEVVHEEISWDGLAAIPEQRTI